MKTKTDPAIVAYLKATVDIAVLRMSTMAPAGTVGYGYRVSILPGRPA